MADKIEKLFNEGQIISHLPLTYANEFLSAFKHAFPNHQAAFLSNVRGGDAEMLVYPLLSPDEKKTWTALYDERHKKLEMR